MQYTQRNILATRIANAIFDELDSRKGILDGVDREIRNEIKEALVEIIADKLSVVI